jgi:pantetheine-phosphate adenylyltransferase
MTTAIYAGSFDPITKGHVAIIRSGLVAFDRIIVAVVINPNKKSLFTIEERKDMIKASLDDDPRVEVDGFEGLLADYAKKKGVNVVLRGLRGVADFEYELQMANMNRNLNTSMETVFIMANDYFYVSSSLVKEAAILGGDVSSVVPAIVAKKLAERLGR